MFGRNRKRHHLMFTRAKAKSRPRPLVDPNHSERLQQTRVLQWTGINGLETKLTDQLHYYRLSASIVANDQHDRLRSPNSAHWDKSHFRGRPDLLAAPPKLERY
jgi:hypothetical protein